MAVTRTDPELIRIEDPSCGLRAFLIIDDETLGPAAGGIRTKFYRDEAAAIADARELASAMTIKCALAGLDAGGAKMVVMDHPHLDRKTAFTKLGQVIQDLGGRFRTAGDLGTTRRDLECVASVCSYVHTDESSLTDAAAKGLAKCMQACVSFADKERSLSDISAAVQGCGSIGEAVARVLTELGARVLVADVDAARAHSVAERHCLQVLVPADVLEADVDIVAPCAVGHVLDVAMVDRLRAWAVCGAANNILCDPPAGERLLGRGIAFVPDPVASAGAVIDGIGASVMGLSDRSGLIDALEATAHRILVEAHESGRPHAEVAMRMADARLRKAPKTHN